MENDGTVPYGIAGNDVGLQQLRIKNKTNLIDMALDAIGS